MDTYPQRTDAMAGICSNDNLAKFSPLNKDATFDRKILKKALTVSSEGIAELLSRSWKQDGKVKGFKKGGIPLPGYFISQESQHRGNIVLTLKKSGEKIPDTVK